MCQRRRAIIYDQSYVLKCSYTNTLVTHIWYMNMIILCTYMTVGMWLHASVDTYMIHINHHIRTPVYTFLVQFLEAHIWLSTIIICLYSYDHMRTYMICTYMTHIVYMIHIYEYTRIWQSYMSKFPLVMWLMSMVDGVMVIAVETNNNCDGDVYERWLQWRWTMIVVETNGVCVWDERWLWWKQTVFML